MPTNRSSHASALLAALCCLLLWACKPAAPPKAAQPASTPADAVALLDGEPLSRTLLDEIARQQAGTSNPYDAPMAAAAAASAASTPAADRQALLEELIGIELLARKARERGLDKQAAVATESELQGKTLLAQIMVREQIAGIAVSDADLAAAYEEHVPPHRFKLAHILAKDPTTAQNVLEQL
ncbi:MAG TPA: hypothetical protein VHQ87_04030, partial [Rhizobacter sp.]|nr:hypothetical protein [Rhizobacter sp.]